MQISYLWSFLQFFLTTAPPIQKLGCFNKSLCLEPARTQRNFGGISFYTKSFPLSKCFQVLLKLFNQAHFYLTEANMLVRSRFNRQIYSIDFSCLNLMASKLFPQNQKSRSLLSRRAPGKVSALLKKKEKNAQVRILHRLTSAVCKNLFSCFFCEIFRGPR